MEMKNLAGPFKSLRLMGHKSVVVDTTQSLIHFRFLTMKVKLEASKTNAKPQFVLTGNTLTVQLVRTKTITGFVDQPSDWKITGTVSPLEKFTETAILLISHSSSRLIDKKVAITLTNTTFLKLSYNLHHKEYIVRPVLRSYSGAIQVYQTSGHGNPRCDSARLSG